MNALAQINRTAILLGGLLAICLLSGNIWAISKMLASQRALTDASEELGKNQQMVANIKRLQDRPRIASLVQEETTGLQVRVQLAMAEAGIPSEKKESSIPSEASQKGTSSYKERTTEIKLNDVTMQQIILFCQHLEDPEKGLTVRYLSMKASKAFSSAASDQWNVIITLSQLIYSVQSAPL